MTYPNKILRKNINRFFGRSQQKQKRPIVRVYGAYPSRPHTLGKSNNSEQGVAGWRTQYHRPPHE